MTDVIIGKMPVSAAVKTANVATSPGMGNIINSSGDGGPKNSTDTSKSPTTPGNKKK